MRDTILIGLTHTGNTEQVLGANAPFNKQMETLRTITRSGEHEKFAEVWLCRPVRRSRRLLTPAKADKKRSAFAKVLADQAETKLPKPQAEAQNKKKETT